MTFGVISLLGMTKLLRSSSSFSSTFHLMNTNAAESFAATLLSFQGDERDVMFLSMVWSPEDSPSASSTTESFGNVSMLLQAARAIEMWLVYSLDPSTNLKSGDLRRRLIEHVLDPWCRHPRTRTVVGAHSVTVRAPRTCLSRSRWLSSKPTVAVGTTGLTLLSKVAVNGWPWNATVTGFIP